MTNLDQLNQPGDLFSDMLHDPEESYLVSNSDKPPYARLDDPLDSE